MVEEFLTMEHEISKILDQYIKLYEIKPVELPVKEIRASIKELYDIINPLKSIYSEDVNKAIKLNLDRLDEDVLSENHNNILYDLKQISFTLSNLAQLIQCINMLYQKKRESEDLTVQRFLLLYGDDTDSEKKQLVEYIRNHCKIDLFNYDFADQYYTQDIDLYYDQFHGLYYTYYHGKKMYLSSFYKNREVAANYIRSLYLEQDSCSPHCYQTDGYEVKEGDIVLDAGAAEGNFALDIIEQASKVYLVECDEAWTKALKLTFEPYKDKVIFINKYLDSYNDESHITIDQLFEEIPVNYIKMDIEGAELEALKGAVNILKNSNRLKCNICSYHKAEDEENIAKILRQNDFNVSTSQGYMFFKNDPYTMLHLDLRRGLIKGTKIKNV